MRRVICISLLLLTSCNFKPGNTRPCWTMPCTWRVEESQERNPNIRWWEQLNEPVLTCLIETTLANNENLKIATATVSQFFFQYALQASQLYPLVTGQGQALRQEFSRDFVPFPAPRLLNQFQALLNLSYEIDVWGRIRNLTDSSLLLFLSQKDARRTVILTLVTQVADAYFELRILDKQLAVSNNTVEIRKRALHIAETQFREGLVSKMEVKQAASLVDDALATVKQIEESIGLQEDLISVLIGENPGPICRGAPLADLQLPPTIPTGLPSDLLQNRPDIMQAEHVLFSLNAQVGAARAAFFPPITLTGFYGGSSTQLKHVLSGADRIWNVTGNVIQTIFDAGALYSNLQITEAQKSQAIHTYILAVQTALQEVNDALISHQKALEIFEVRKDQVDVLQDYYNLALLQYNNGQVDYLTVLDAERNLFTAELQLAQSEGDRFTTLVQIYGALGGGWVCEADRDLTVGINPCNCQAKP